MQMSKSTEFSLHFDGVTTHCIGNADIRVDVDLLEKMQSKLLKQKCSFEEYAEKLVENDLKESEEGSMLCIMDDLTKCKICGNAGMALVCVSKENHPGLACLKCGGEELKAAMRRSYDEGWDLEEGRKGFAPYLQEQNTNPEGLESFNITKTCGECGFPVTHMEIKGRQFTDFGWVNASTTIKGQVESFNKDSLCICGELEAEADAIAGEQK